jgi:hypothetical protein
MNILTQIGPGGVGSQNYRLACQHLRHLLCWRSRAGGEIRSNLPSQRRHPSSSHDSPLSPFWPPLSRGEPQVGCSLTLGHLDNTFCTCHAFYFIFRPDALPCRLLRCRCFESVGFAPWVRQRFQQIVDHEADHVAFLSTALGLALLLPSHHAPFQWLCFIDSPYLAHFITSYPSSNPTTPSRPSQLPYAHARILRHFFLPLYAAFCSGLRTEFAPLDRSMFATISADLIGTIYIVISTNGTVVTDDSPVAGPAIFNFRLPETARQKKKVAPTHIYLYIVRQMTKWLYSLNFIILLEYFSAKFCNDLVKPDALA